MKLSYSQINASRVSLWHRSKRSRRSFTLIELLTVMGIMAIIIAIAVSLLPNLLSANKVDQSVAKASGILEEARAAAVSGNTYVWVAFTTNSLSLPADGVWAAIIQSVDGTENPINTNSVAGVAPSPIAWTTTNITIPSSNLQLLGKIENLPGISIVDPGSLTSAITNSYATTNLPGTNWVVLCETNSFSWTITPYQNTEGNVNFCKAIEFTPDGEAHTATTNWYNSVEFGIVPSIGSTTNSALINVSRLTGKITVYRP